MPFVVNLAISAVFSYVVYLLTPKQKPPKAATLDDFDIPRAEEGDEIGKVYGTVWIKSPQIACYGDLKSVAIKEKTGKK
ncbi:hypothetical protein OE699_02025 [Sedimentimonas flavescens]|uniref:Uncharacterized protein n=1 Tax=Sedimentimonas flavescens TaxID=2851012 RepID=A0ABT2ZV43_9RHOB|nr:hypothetical protein [Sedimentimonas flavescens]MCV2877617.1 hypothetical protein [Sedimentimonas flavescens]